MKNSHAFLGLPEWAGNPALNYQAEVLKVSSRRQREVGLVEELSEFLKDAYLNTSAERDSFTVDLKRQREVTLQTLREIPEYYAVHLLAAAGLWGCGELQVSETELPGYVPLLRPKRWEYRLSLENCKLQEEKIKQLPSAVNASDQPALKRLALTLYQLGLGEVKDIRLVFNSEEAVLFFDWVEETPVLRSRSPSSGPVGKLEIIFITPTRSWGKEQLRQAACWSPLAVRWQGEFLVTNYRKAARRQCIWWGEVSEENHYEVEAYLPHFPRRNSMTILGIFHTVPLESVTLDSLKMEESFFPGLVLVIHSSAFQVDGSQRRLVINDNLMRLLRDVVARVRVAFQDAAVGQTPLLQSYIADHPECFPNLSKKLPTPNYETDPYLFRHGYAIAEDWAVYGGLKGVTAFGLFQVSSLYFEPKGVTARHRSYPKNTPQGVAGHPHLPITAIVFRNYLEVWDDQQGVRLHYHTLPGLNNALFTRDGSKLVAITTTRDVSKAWVLKAQDGVIDSEPVLLPTSHKIRAGHQVLLLSDLRDEWRVFKLDGSSEPKKLRLPTSANLWDIDPSEDLALFSYGEQSYLVNLLNGQVRTVPGTLPTFHSGDRILTHTQRGLRGRRQVTFYSKQLLALETAGVEQHFTVSDSGVIAQSKYPCGNFLNSFAHYSYPNHRLFTAPTFVNFDGSETSAPDEPLLLLRNSHEVANSQTLLRLDKGKWSEIYRMREPALALTPAYLAWQVGEDTFVLSRNTVQTEKYAGQSLYRNLLTKKIKNRVSFQSLNGDSKHDLRLPDGPWRSHRHLSREGHHYKLVQVMPISLNVTAAVCCQTGECLVRTRAFRLEANHRWAVKIRDSLLRTPTKVYVRPLKKGASWRLLGHCSSYAIHPKEPRLYYLDREGVPKVLDLTDRYAKLQNGTTKFGWVTVSPSGRYLSVTTPWQKSLYCSDSLRPLWHFNNDMSAHKLGFCSLGAEVKWCNDQCILVDGVLYRSDKRRGWAGTRRVSQPVQGPLFTDGRTDLALRLRAGLIDLFCLKTAQILATLQVSPQGWFAFTPTGVWDCSYSNLEEITPQPQITKRREGLLKDLIAVDD